MNAHSEERVTSVSKKKGPKYEQIIEAAVTVIAKHGYHQAQVAKIAKEAGVADGTIYLYFKSKEELLVSMFAEKMGQFIEKTRHHLMSEQAIEKKFFLFIHLYFNQLQEQPALAVVTQLELRQANRELRQRINSVLKGYLVLLDELIIEGMENNYFKRTIDMRLARQMVFGTLDEVVTNWVMNDYKYELLDLATPVHQLLIGGLRAGSKF